MPREQSEQAARHEHPHAFGAFLPFDQEGLVVRSRRNWLKASLAGIAGLSVADLLKAQSHAASAGASLPSRRSVILLWMTGGPSQIDTWDPKPERPLENRGPFGVIPTTLPGVIVCEHLPKFAAMMNQFTLIRSVDCRYSNHEPNMVMQTANLDAEPRTNPLAPLYPSFGSIVSKFRGPNHPEMPPYVGFYRSSSHIAFGGYVGKQFDPFQGNDAATLPVYDLVGNDTGRLGIKNIFKLPAGLTQDHLADRHRLQQGLDAIESQLDGTGTMQAMDAYSQKAARMLVGRRARDAFDLSLEHPRIRDRYGKHLWCQQALLARRLVEAGVSFVTIDLSYHTASGTWDNHGDNIPPYGGISKGLRPLLPLFDHLITTLVSDLGDRGLLDEVLVIAMGEFGRTPTMGTQGSTDGRNHWPVVMSMTIAGGGFRHGQVIGASERDGGSIKERPVTPGDLAATIYRHMGVPLDSTYLDFQGRPHPIVSSGSPLPELGC